MRHSRPIRRAARAALAAILAASLAGPARADSPQTGAVDGRVLDAAGGALAGIAVAIESDRGERRTASDVDGRFLFGRLSAGDYLVRAELPGVATAETRARLEAGARVTVELRLGLAIQDSIDAAAARITDTQHAGVASALDTATAAMLTFSTRNYQTASASLPGTILDSGMENTPSVNGGLWQENGAFLDGVDITDLRWGGGSRIFLPTSVLAEIRSDASGYGAEYGRAVSGVTSAVTKSGTNAFHGDFLLVVQSPAWRAQSDVVPLDREDRLLLGHEASLGGPVLRDRAWFFAASAETTSNLTVRLAGGDIVDRSLESDSLVGKLAADLSDRHHLSLTAVDAPATVPLVAPTTADRYAVTESELGMSFVTLGWGWTAARARFVEARVAAQRSTPDRRMIALPEIRPGASPDDPAGNRGAYWDGTNGLRWHASDQPLGPGSLEFPRDQANVGFTWLLDRHELELGADYQEVAWKALNRPPERYLGGGYDPALAGGFVRPDLKRVFLPADASVKTRGTNLAAFAQNRIEVGARLAVSVGARVEDQAHENDRGREALASTDVTPRASLVYDVGADGRVLVKATAGRYVTHVPQEIVNREFATLANGANAFDEYRFNPATGRYDLFNRRQLPALLTPVNALEPYSKDELTAGVEWQIDRAWTLEARAIAWIIDAPWSATDQFDERGALYRLLTNFTQAERKYRGLQLEANRALRDGSLVRANYTLSRVEGNSSGNGPVDHTSDDFQEAMTVVDPSTGEPVTAINRYGRLPHDRTHILNLSGARSWTLGADHAVSLGGWLAFRSGEPWGLRSTVALRSPASAAAIVTTRYDEARDAHTLADNYTLNLTAAWEFPLPRSAVGSLRVEAVNATDEQEQIDVSLETGEPILVAQSYQRSRELRLVAGVRF